MNRMGGAILCVGPLLMGCTEARYSSSTYQVADPPYPLALETAVPDDVLPGDVLVRENCYYYRRAGAIHPVPFAHDGADGASSRPYCFGAG